MSRVSLRATAFAFGLGVTLPCLGQTTPTVENANPQVVEFPGHVIGGAIRIYDINGNVVGGASHPMLVACPDGTTNCFSGGGGGGGNDAASATGAAPPASADYLGANASGATGGKLAGIVQCDKSAYYDDSSAGMTKVITGVASRKIYICGYVIATGATATNVDIGSGTGTNCGTTYTQMEPAWQLGINDKIGAISPFWNGLVSVNAGEDLCINASDGNPVQFTVRYAIL
jgi:hypothetical protein